MALFREIMEDIQTVLERDPAARNSLEVLICYPGVWALILHKPAHWCYRMHLKMLVYNLHNHNQHQLLHLLLQI